MALPAPVQEALSTLTMAIDADPAIQGALYAGWRARSANVAPPNSHSSYSSAAISERP